MPRAENFRRAFVVVVLLFLTPAVALAGPAEDGNAAYKRGDFATAMKLWLPLADQGNAAAQNNIGVMYRDGRGVPKNDSEAVKWFRKSAEQGFAHGQIGIGWAYEQGLGIKQDYAAAANWYRKAAEQGIAAAQNNTGVMYRDGRGVKQDRVEAIKWFRKAAEQGFAPAQNELGRAYQNGLGVKQNYGAAVAWYRKAAEHGLARAQSNVGAMYSAGHGVKRDYAEAARWFRKSAEQGYAWGQVQLGWTYEFGLGVKQSYVDAVKWYRKADKQGEKQAKAAFKRIGDTKIVQAILKMRGVYDGPIDGARGAKTVAAIKWFQKATGRPQTGQIDNDLIETLDSRLDMELDKDKTRSVVDEGMKLIRAGFFEAGAKKFETAIDLGYPNTFGPRLYPYMKTHLSALGTISLHQWNSSLKGKKISRIGVFFDDHPIGSGKAAVLIKGVFPKGAAEVAGVKKRDIVIGVDNQRYLNEKQLNKYIQAVSVGQTIQLAILRDGHSLTIPVKTGAGFHNLAMAIFALYEFGFVANQAGHPGITLQAAATLRHAAEQYPAAMHGDNVEPYYIALEALGWAAQGQYDKAYRHIVEEGGLTRQGADLAARYIKWFPNAWKALYANRKKLSYILKMDERALPRPSTARQAPQPYPDINGKLISPAAPPMLAPPAQTAGRPKLPQSPSQSGQVGGAPKLSRPPPPRGSSDVMVLE